MYRARRLGRGGHGFNPSGRLLMSGRGWMSGRGAVAKVALGVFMSMAIVGTVVTNVGASPQSNLDVSLESPGTVTMGRDAQWAIAVSNLGDGPSSAPVTVRVSDHTSALPLPAPTPIFDPSPRHPEIAFGGATGDGWDCTPPDGGYLECTLASSIAVGGDAPDLFVTTIGISGREGDVQLEAQVSADGDMSDESSAKKSSSATAQVVAEFDVGVTMTSTEPLSRVGEPGQVVTTVRSSHGSIDGPIVASLFVPAGWTNSGDGWACEVNTCTHSGPLPASPAALPPIVSSGTMPMPGGFPDFDGVVMAAWVQHAVDQNTVNNAVLLDLDVVAPVDIVVTRSTMPDTVTVGEPFTVTLKAKNRGYEQSSGLVYVSFSDVGRQPSDPYDDGEPGRSMISMTGDGWQCTNSQPGGQAASANCVYQAPVAAGAELADITATVVPIVPTWRDELTMTVTSGHYIEGASQAHTQTFTVGVVGRPNLRIFAGSTGGTPINSPMSFTVGVANDGRGTVEGPVTVRINGSNDEIPFALSGATGDGWQCGAVDGDGDGDGEIECVRDGDVAEYEEIPTLSVTGSTSGDAMASGTTSIGARIVSPSDWYPDDDVTSASATIRRAVDAKVELDSPEPFVVGEVQTLRARVVSTGVAYAAPVKVSWTLPEGFVATGAGWVCTSVHSNAYNGGWYYRDAYETSSCVHPGPIPESPQALSDLTATATVRKDADGEVTTSANATIGAPPVYLSSFSRNLTVVSPVDFDVKVRSLGSYEADVYVQAAVPTQSTIDVKNLGIATAATGTTVSVYTSEFDSTTISGEGWTCTGGSGNQLCTYTETVPAGASPPSLTYTMTPRVADVGDWSCIDLVVAHPNDTRSNNNSTRNCRVVRSPDDVSIGIGSDWRLDVGVPGDTEVKVRNSGNATIDKVVTVNGAAGPGMSFLAATGDGWDCSMTAEAFDCTTDEDVAKNEELPPIAVRVVATVAAFPEGRFTATVTVPGDVHIANNTTYRTFDIRGVPDLEAAIGRPHLIAGRPVVIEAGVVNRGTVAATGPTTVRLDLPVGVTAADTAGGNGWNCDVQERWVQCVQAGPIGEAYSDSSRSHFEVALTAVAPGTATLGYRVESLGDPTVDTGTVQFTVDDVVDLAITQNAPLRIAAGSTGTITLDVSNVGGETTVAPITVTDTLPLQPVTTGDESHTAQLDPLSASGEGWECTITGQNVTCTRNAALGAGATAPSISIVVRASADASVTVLNQAAVSSPDDTWSDNDLAAAAIDVKVPQTSVSLNVSAQAGYLSQSVSGTLRVTVHNTGTETVQPEVRLEATGLDIDGTTSLDWTCSPAPLVRCTPSSAITPGTVRTFDLAVLPSATATTATIEADAFSNGSSIGRRTSEIPLVPTDPPSAALNVDSTIGDAPMTVVFNSRLSAGTITRYELDFGDGSDPITGVANSAADIPTTSHTYDNPGGYLAKLTVSDARRSDVSAVVIVVTPPPPPEAVIETEDDLEIGPGDEINLTATSIPDRPSSSYRWSFGDGTSATGKSVKHTYEKADDYDVKLTVTLADNTKLTDEIVVHVGSTVAKVKVAVRTQAGSPVAGATVLGTVGSRKTRPAITNAAGEATIKLRSGTTSARIYALNAPRTATGENVVKLVNNVPVGHDSDNPDVVVAIDGFVSTLVDSAPVPPSDFEKYGIPAGEQSVTRYQIELNFRAPSGGGGGGGSSRFCGIVNGSGAFVGSSGNCNDGGGGWSCGDWCTYNGGGDEDDIYAFPGGGGGGGAPTYVMFLSAPGTIRTLKQYWTVSVTIQNTSPKDATTGFGAGKASLRFDQPSGVSVVSNPPEIPPIGPRESRTATWVVRGDTPGQYFPSVTYSAPINPFDVWFSRSETAKEPIEVGGGGGLQLIVEAPSPAYRLLPYPLALGVKNNGTLPVYDVDVDNDLKEPDNFTCAPGEQPLRSIAEVPPGATVMFDPYTYIPTGDGELDAYGSFVAASGGLAASNPLIIPVPNELDPETILKAKETDQTYGMLLQWDPVPGASYDVYVADSYDCTGVATPLATVGADQPTQLQVPVAIDDTAKKYAVIRTILDGKSTIRHEVVEMEWLGPPLPSDACEDDTKVGTPECPDRDGDGVPDVEDGCPDVPGSYDNGGCPGTVCAESVVEEKHWKTSYDIPGPFNKKMFDLDLKVTWCKNPAPGTSYLKNVEVTGSGSAGDGGLLGLGFGLLGFDPRFDKAGLVISPDAFPNTGNSTPFAHATATAEFPICFTPGGLLTTLLSRRLADHVLKPFARRQIMRILKKRGPDFDAITAEMRANAFLGEIVPEFRRTIDKKATSSLTTMKIPNFIKVPAVEMLMKWVDKKLDKFKWKFVDEYTHGEIQGVSDSMMAEQIAQTMASLFVAEIFEPANVCDADALPGDPDLFVVWKPTMAMDIADDGQSLKIERFDDRLGSFAWVADLKVEDDD